MKVIELLDGIIAAYPGATSEAIKAFKPVFYARLQKHEGPALAEAYAEVLANFRPHARQPFPIPSNFENHLPSGKLNLDGVGPSIRASLAERSQASKRHYAQWVAGQGAKIKAHRPKAVYAACMLEAMERAKLGKPVILSTEQIEICEQRAVSQARVRLFGSLPHTEEKCLAQIDEVRASWARSADTQEAMQ